MLNIYLTFDGNCREAFEFYRSVFGGEFSSWATYAEGPPEMKVPDEQRDRIMHVSLPVDSSVLMGSDSSSVSPGPPLTAGNNFSISVTARNREHCDTLFAKLSEGGQVGMSMQPTFWGSYFGTLTDRFGINWMVTCALTPA